MKDSTIAGIKEATANLSPGRSICVPFNSLNLFTESFKLSLYWSGLSTTFVSFGDKMIDILVVF